jgi:hypothetical protein
MLRVSPCPFLINGAQRGSGALQEALLYSPPAADVDEETMRTVHRKCTELTEGPHH